MRRALSTRSGMGQTHVGAAFHATDQLHDDATGGKHGRRRRLDEVAFSGRHSQQL